ncbi:MAG: hypothetical protein ACRC1K_04590 [Planctomycetia bacterium]
MISYASLCSDFYLNCYLNTEMELPQNRDTVLHYFRQMGKAFPTMSNFYTREPGEFVLEEDKQSGSYRWSTLEARRIASGHLSPSTFEDCHRHNELMLELAPPLLSIDHLDCEALDVMFGFDFVYKGNHDEVVAEALLGESKLGSLLSLGGSRTVDFEPTLTIALDEACRQQARLSIATRTNSYQVRTGQYDEEAISVYFTIRQYWNSGTEGAFADSYRRQFEIGQELVDSLIVPNIVVPLSEAISAR